MLIVEDNAPLRESCARTFAQNGHRVETAADGEAALAILRAGHAGVGPHIDAVVADLKLPGISGHDVIQTMLAEGIEAAPIIYTAFPDDEIGREAKAQGIVVVSKLEMANLRELVRLVAHTWRDHRARRSAKADEVARLLTTITAKCGGESALASKWRTGVATPLARALADPTMPFAVFLTIAEALRFVMGPAHGPRTVATALQLQADRCSRRREVADAIGLDRVAARLGHEHRGRLWALAHSRLPPAWVNCAHVDRGLWALGWSRREVQEAVALRYAVIRVADSDQQSAQIAFELGVEHPPAFNRFFKNWLGLAPRELRKLLQDG